MSEGPVYDPKPGFPSRFDADDTLKEVQQSANAEAAVRILNEAMETTRQQYEQNWGTATTLNGTKENYHYTHSYLPRLSLLLNENRMIPAMVRSWAQTKKQELDPGGDGYANLAELQLARKATRNAVDHAFIDHMVQNYYLMKGSHPGIPVDRNKITAPMTRIDTSEPATVKIEKKECPQISQQQARTEERDVSSSEILAARVETGFIVRKGDTYWSIARRSIIQDGESPTPAAIATEAKRLESLNKIPAKSLREGQLISKWDDVDLAAWARGYRRD